jgi:mRNA interferase HicA
MVIIFVYHDGGKEHGIQAMAGKTGSTFIPVKGSHFIVLLNNRRSVIPMHNKDLKTGIVEVIKKQLGLKD